MKPVLVVEDHTDLRDAIVATLHRAHFACVSTSSADAIGKLQERSYSAIVLDPPSGDDPVMRYLREHQPSELQKVLVIGEDAVTDSPYPQIRKPFNASELVSRLPIK